MLFQADTGFGHLRRVLSCKYVLTVLRWENFTDTIRQARRSLSNEKGGVGERTGAGDRDSFTDACRNLGKQKDTAVFTTLMGAFSLMRL